MSEIQASTDNRFFIDLGNKTAIDGVIPELPNKLADKYVRGDHSGHVYGIRDYYDEENKNALKYTPGKGYIFPDGYVRIYRKRKSDFDDGACPIFYYDNGIFVTMDIADEYMESFHIDRITSLSIQSVNGETPIGHQPYNEKVLMALTSSAEIFKPTINEDDDPLKKIIKTAIISKGINVSKLNAFVDAKCRLNNMKSALMKKTKMSIDYFTQWCELLGLDFQFRVIDNGFDEIDPLLDEVSYDSAKNKIFIGEIPNYSGRCTIKKKKGVKNV